MPGFAGAYEEIRRMFGDVDAKPYIPITPGNPLPERPLDV